MRRAKVTEKGKGQEVQPRAEGSVMSSLNERRLMLSSSAGDRYARYLLIVVLLVLGVFCVFGAVARAEAPGPIWKIMAVSNPTNLRPGDDNGGPVMMIAVTNVGDGSTNGSTIAISDKLPSGLKATKVIGVDSYKHPVFKGEEEEEGSEFFDGLACSLTPVPHCTVDEPVDPGDTLLITIKLDVETTVEGLTEPNEASVSGGGAAAASVSEPVMVSSALPEYGLAKGGLLAAESTGQAGAHPNVTVNYFLNTVNKEEEVEESRRYKEAQPVGEPKDVDFDLPAGLVGTTVGMPRCTMSDVTNATECPRDTMVGMATLMVWGQSSGRLELTVPVFNITPAPGEPAAFAFNALFFPVRLDTSVLSDGEYNVRFSAPDITTGALDYFSSVTIWGVPAEHYGAGPDQSARALEAEAGAYYNFGGPGVEDNQNGGSIYEVLNDERAALVTNPSQCSAPLEGLLETDSWEAQGIFAHESVSLGVATGCNQLRFDPSVSMLPDTRAAGAPAGYTFDLDVPQDTEPGGLATPDVKRTLVTLPAGTVISPSAADGLGDCTDEEFELRSGVPGRCPDDSQVGVVEVETPALEKPLDGDVYLGSPECEPCSSQDAQDGRMVRLFLQFVGKGEDGVIVKLEGHGYINQQTGQLTTVFENTPQLPFGELKLKLTGGERATLSNPRSCGVVTTMADLTPWSTPYTPDATPSSSFEVNEGCIGSQFGPSFAAGTTSNQAGGFSPFTLSFGRSDADEFLNGIQLQMPPGLLGMISRVRLCGEQQAAEGTCGPESQIGEVSVETGPGADPYLVTGGKVFITGPYKGAPYGLSIVVPAKAGPYTLSGTTGKGTVVVRSSIAVNPTTAALTVTSDPLPTELDGIPLQLRRVNVTVGTNNNFTFNPTSCEKMEVKGTLTSVANTVSGQSSSFQVTNCAGLKFQPKFNAQTSAKTSKTDGASLLFKLSYPTNAGTSQAWFSKMKFDIPKQLPARLTTIQKACLAKVFETNPAACPAASNIGRAIVHTPLLPVPVEGPVYFVSYGGQKFPEVVLVLQGDGVTVDLHGETNIKGGVTSAIFRSVPDVPFETAEVYVPTGPFSEFTAIGNVCKETLTMPVAFTPQNGSTEIHESTKIGVTGCPKTKTVKKKKQSKTGTRKSGASHGRKS
jgi:hypothetical protein